MSQASKAERSIISVREMPFPRELVFAAFTDREHIGNWWGPNGFTTTTSEMDVRPGGVWRYVMHGPDGVDFPNLMEYDVVDPPSRLEYRHSGDADGPVEFRSVVTFDDLGGSTRVTLLAVLPTTEMRDRLIRDFGADEGGKQTLARLEAHLTGTARGSKLVVTTPSDVELVLTRVFDAPAALVFEAMSKPEHVRRWWPCEGSEMTVCDIDLRPGGAYRFAMVLPNGFEVPFRGEYLEIDPPGRIVFTEIFDVEPHNAHPAVVTTTFQEREGRTTMIVNVRHDSKESRDAHLNSGMESGAAACYDRVEAIAQELAGMH
jgi:uncharacterized protein YndB with AHSA1/START domain